MSYFMGQGHDHLGPGTSMVQFVTPGLSGCGCNCGGSCMGLGFFEGGLDFKTWGWLEWSAVALGVYSLYSIVSTTGRGYRAGRKKFDYIKGAGARRRRSKATELRKRAELLEAA